MRKACIASAAALSGLLATLAIAVYADDGVPREQRMPSRSQIEDFETRLGATVSDSARPLVPLAPDLIIDFEGWEPIPYDDPSGYCTVGFGHLIKKSKCATLDLSMYSKPLTRGEGEVLLESDTRSARLAVQKLISRELKDHEFGALASFVFNVGKNNFAGSTLRQLINDGYPAAAAKELGRWILSNKKVLRGLIDRRACEAALFKNELQGDEKGRFDRKECSILGATPPGGKLIDVLTGDEVEVEEVEVEER